MSEQEIIPPHAVMGPEMLNPEFRNRKAPIVSDQEIVRHRYPDARCITRASREKRVSYCIVSDDCIEQNEYGVVRGIGVWCMTEERAWFDAAQRLRCHINMPADYTVFEVKTPRAVLTSDALWGSDV